MRVVVHCRRTASRPMFSIDVDMPSVPRYEELIRIDEYVYRVVMVEHVVPEDRSAAALPRVLVVETS